ncbi:MAG TPA: response regulator [Nitrospiraceae bacterium]|nr:response regulator [Nitrospiraceae bacterium]
MIHILLATIRQEAIQTFTDCLALDSEIRLDQVTSGSEALTFVRTKCPHLVIVDSELPDTKPLDLVRKIINANAMVNTVVVSPLPNEDFHVKSEGLGVLCRLPPDLGWSEADGLLKKLRSVL